MTKEKSPTLLKALSIVITIIQLFDIAIHAATDQLEPLRVTSNLIILVWLVVLISGKLGEKNKSVALGSIGAYLGINIIFLALEGLTNPNNGTLRVTLFLLVILTMAFSAGLFTQLKKMKTQNKNRKIPWLPILLIVWNIFDAGFHIAIGSIEPVRITGNIIGVAAAFIVLLGLAKTYAPHLLGLGAAVIIIINSTQPPFSGPVKIIVLTFIGVSVFLLLRWAQVKAQVAYAEAGLGSNHTDTPIYLRWCGALLVTLVGLAIIYLVGSQIDPPPYAFMSIEQTDTTADSSLPREINGQSAEILAAFFGLDDDMPSWAGNLCPDAPGKDGMPVVLSTEIDFGTMQAGDFQITTASGKIGSLVCATMWPAVDVGELRTVLLVGDFGSSDQDPPVRLEIIGNLHSIDNAVNFKGAEIMITPLESGPSMVFAEIVPQDEWRLGDEGSQGGTGCPAEGVQQIVRVAWDGGVKLENGDEPGDTERQLYTVTVKATDGSTNEVIPFALGDLGDGDNNHKLCLDTNERVLSVSFPAGILVDPNHDLNPETMIQVTQ